MLNHAGSRDSDSRRCARAGLIGAFPKCSRSMRVRFTATRVATLQRRDPWFITLPTFVDTVVS
jgi:hypothetical protein